MKTKAILAFVIAGAMSFTACTKKVDEKTLAEVNQFGTEWTALGEQATNWSNELSQTVTQAKEFAGKQNERMASMATSKDEAMKTQMNEMVKQSNDNVATLENMQTEWNTFKSTWDETTRQYTEWKDKVVKGEVTSEEAATGLVEFRTKMTDAQTKIEGWNHTYAETKANYEHNLASADEMTKSTSTTSTPSPKK
jgi:peptidoglycan hydrolase CwlO-like protein